VNKSEKIPGSHPKKMPKHELFPNSPDP
jgi:hypothetical protein